jgi:aspartyl-tRNA(Asn)/glutamyl-tRNA(Gln) amidotransferase subunit C
VPEPAPHSRERLTAEDVSKVADLAMLAVDDADLARYAGQLDDVLDMAERLESFDLDDVPPTSHPFGLVNVFRDDEPAVGADAEEMRRLALSAGPEIEDDRFKVPPALGEEP